MRLQRVSQTDTFGISTGCTGYERDKFYYWKSNLVNILYGRFVSIRLMLYCAFVGMSV
jgi:hypothetical protein